MICLEEVEDHTVRRCLELIERHAPRLMVAGQGPLVQERPRNGRRLTWHQKLRIVTYAKKAQLTQAEIARRVGCTEPTVARVVREASFAKATEVRPVLGTATVAGLRKLGAKLRRWKPRKRRAA